MLVNLIWDASGVAVIYLILIDENPQIAWT